MYSILEEFAYGNICPNDQGFKRNSTFDQAMRAVSDNEEKLLAQLACNSKVLLEKYIEAQGEVNRLTAVKNLIYGYKLGLLMTAESFLTSDDLVAGWRKTAYDGLHQRRIHPDELTAADQLPAQRHR